MENLSDALQTIGEQVVNCLLLMKMLRGDKTKYEVAKKKKKKERKINIWQ